MPRCVPFLTARAVVDATWLSEASGTAHVDERGTQEALTLRFVFLFLANE